MLRIRIVLIALAVLLPVAALAGAYGDLVKVETAFQNVKSFHAVEQFSNGRSSVCDYVAPDRWRLQDSPKEAEIIIGNDVYIESNGKTSRMPFGGGIIRRLVKHFSNLGNDSEIRATAQDLGMRTLNGESVHVYSFKSHGALDTLYVDPDSLPVENVVKSKKNATTITYSEYNQPITIEP